MSLSRAALSTPLEPLLDTRLDHPEYVVFKKLRRRDIILSAFSPILVPSWTALVLSTDEPTDTRASKAMHSTTPEHWPGTDRRPMNASADYLWEVLLIVEESPGRACEMSHAWIRP